jgi:transcriptional adapter 1
MSSDSLELNQVRRKLTESLGDDASIYFQHLRNWFTKKCTKEEFDYQARRMIKHENIHLHNQFFLAILTKCQSLVTLSATPSKPEYRLTLDMGQLNSDSSPREPKKAKVKKKNKSNKSSLDQRFQTFTPSDMAPRIPDTTIHAEEKKLAYCQDEGTLPDVALIHGRMLVAAWESGVEGGCEDEAVNLIMVSVQHFLKNVITSVLMSRNPWRTREGAVHSLGAPIPNPWLKSTQIKRKQLCKQNAVTEATLQNEAGLAPAPRTEADIGEAEAMYEAALGITKRPKARLPISLFDLLKVLKEERDIIPNHTVHSINVERIIMKLNV